MAHAMLDSLVETELGIGVQAVGQEQCVLEERVPQVALVEHRAEVQDLVPDVVRLRAPAGRAGVGWG